MKIGIIGAGHAGVEAARVATVAGAEVTLFSNESVPPYFRPRLVAVAFGQVAPDAVGIKPVGWYSENRIDLRLNTEVTALNAAACSVTAGGQTYAFDGIVLTAGSKPFLPPFVSTVSESRVLPLWDMAHALMIRDKITKSGRCAIVGGGILGIEAALRAREIGMSVTIIERLDRLMPAQFGCRASSVLLRQLQSKGVDVRLARSVVRVDAEDSSVRLQLDDGSRLPADVCLVSIGTRPFAGLAAAAGIEIRRGIVVDGTLATSCSRVFAAGDVIECEGITRCSVREATAQGKLAGENVVASIRRGPLTRFEPLVLPLSFKSGEFELCALGIPSGDDAEEEVLDVPVDSAFRALIRRQGQIVGVQMVGTREGLDELARQVVSASR